jgi:hypothetical protein
MKYRRLKRGDKIVFGTQFKWNKMDEYCPIVDKIWIRNNSIYNETHPAWMRTPIKSKKQQMIALY